MGLSRLARWGLITSTVSVFMTGCGPAALQPPHIAPPVGAVSQADYNNMVDAWVSRVSGRVVMLTQAKIAFDQGAYPMPLLATEAQTAADETSHALHAVMGTTPPVGDVREEQNLLKDLTLLEGALQMLQTAAKANQPTAVQTDIRTCLALAAQVESETPTGNPTIAGTPQQQTPFPEQQ